MSGLMGKNLDNAGVGAFGPGFTTTGPVNGTGVQHYIRSERYQELEFKQGYFDCTQHDWKEFDFDGRPSKPGPPTMQPMLSYETTGYLVPLKFRKPSHPYRLGKIIVKRYTDLIFGEGRFPDASVPGDMEAQEFVKALIAAQSLPVNMVEARNKGGSQGCVGMSWCFKDGNVLNEVHNGKYIIVQEWKDRKAGIPCVVTEVYRYYEDQYSEEKKSVVRNWFWFRRDWTENADITYNPVEVDSAKEPAFSIDYEKTVFHNDGVCHFIWFKNTPSDSVDSEADYDGLYESFDTIDLLYSIMNRGTIANMDPTLVLNIDKAASKAMGGVKKGSENALSLEKDEKASYLELAGSSINVAIQVFELNRKTALETASCVVPDPDTIAAQGVSSVAIKAIYSPMLASCDTRREQYGAGIRRLLEDQLMVARKYYQAGKVLNLEPIEETSEEVDPITGETTGNLVISFRPVTPGKAGFVKLTWPPYFPLTPEDKQKIVTVATTASGGKAVMSQKAAVKITAQAFDLDPEEEMQQIAQEATQARSMGDGLGADLDAAAGGKVIPPPVEEEGEDSPPFPLTRVNRRNRTEPPLKQRFSFSPYPSPVFV